MLKIELKSAVSVTAMILWASSASAQTVPADSAQTVSAAPEDVVVTARKRSEVAIDVPISLAVYDENALRRAGAHDFADVADAVPGVAFASVGVGASRVFIRGIGQVTTGQSPTTAFYLDEILLNQPRTSFGSAQPDPLLADIARVEVLRGPQGTLFGASSLGGAVRLISNRPDATRSTFDLDTRLGFRHAGGADWLVSGVVNLPVVEDRLAVRIVGVSRGDEGWIDDLSPQVANVRENLGTNRVVHDVNKTYSNGARVTTAFTPDSDTRVQLSGIYQRSRAEGLARPEIDVSFGLKSQLVGRFQPTSADDDFKALSLVLERQVHALGGLALTSATAYIKRSFSYSADNTPFGNGGINVEFPRPAPFEAYRIRALFQQVTDYHTVTQELRAATTGSGPLSIIAGLYFADSRQGGETIRGVSQDFGAGAPKILNQTNSLFLQKEYAAFGEFDIKLLPRLTITGGGRLYHYDQHETKTLFGRGGPAIDPGLNQVDGRLKESGFSPRAVASYRLRRDMTIYASYTEGFRTGGVNAPIPEDVCPASVRNARGIPELPPPFKSDKVRTYEIGAKAALAGGRLTAEASVYYNDWLNYQQSVQQDCGPLGSVASYSANAGRVRTRGFEADLGARPLSGVSLHAGAAYTDATFRKDVPELGFVVGDRLTDVPRWTFSGSADYETPIGPAAKLVLHADARHIGSSITGFGEGERIVRPAYTLVGATAGISTGPLEVSLFVRNLTNATPIYAWEFSTSPTVGGDPNFLNAVVGEPRTIGLELVGRFGH